MDLSDLKSGRRGAIARMISIMENDRARAREVVKEIFRDTGNSVVIGFTGPAGSGKSSLINRIAAELKKRGKNPAVLAVDPTSHLSGGAILGDRVRMTESTDSGVYIRSVASRGATGAVSASVQNSIRVLEYAGFDPVIIESVGAGQTEVEISNIADVVVVVFNPHTGDSIQAIKAGLTEIGDIYLVNKSDLAGASRLFDAVCEYIGSAEGGPAVLKTSAKTGRGMAVFVRMLMEMIGEREMAGPGREAARLEAELRSIILNNIKTRVDALLETDATYKKCLKEVQGGQIDPFEAADRISENLVR